MNSWFCGAGKAKKKASRNWLETGSGHCCTTFVDLSRVNRRLGKHFRKRGSRFYEASGDFVSPVNYRLGYTV